MHIKHLFCSWSSCKKNVCISHRPTRLSISRVWGMPHLRAEICLALNDRWILRAKANHRKLILERKMIKKEREITSRIVNFLQGKMKDTELRAIIWQYSCAIKYLTKHQQPNWTSSKNERNKTYIYIFPEKKELLLGRHSHNLKTRKNYTLFYWNDDTFFFSVFVFVVPQANKSSFALFMIISPRFKEAYH